MTGTHTRAAILLVGAGLGALALAGQAQAQEAAGEIIVTATRSKETISKVPISIVAYDAKALNQSGVKSIADLASIAPGVEFDQSAGFGPGTQTNIAIRGISSTVGTSTTGVYIDDTPIQSRIAALSYWGNPFPVIADLERVEVDRGPQGTLFGAGSEGGAIRFISPEPSLTKTTGTLHAEAGGRDGGAGSYEGSAALGTPLIADTLGLRASFYARHEGGYVDRVNPFTDTVVKQNANSSNALAGRLALLWEPAPNLKITPSVYAQSVHTADSSAFYEGLGNPAAGAFHNGRLLAQPNTERFVLPSLKIEWTLGGITLTSVSSYFNRAAHLLDDTTGVNGTSFGTVTGFDASGNPLITPGYGDPRGPAYPTSADQAGPEAVSTDMTTFTQELRAANRPGGRLKWTAGVFWSNAHQIDTQAAYSPWVVTNFINPILSFFGAPGQSTADPILYSQILSIDKQIAGFGQIDYKLSPKLTFTLGARIAHHIASYSQSQSGFLSSTGAWGSYAYSAGSQSQTPWSGKAGLAWQIDPATMLYASASRGYRVGGANQPISSTCGVNVPATYGSDYVDSFEGGVKGKAAGGHLRFEAASFYTNWKNIQQSIFFACQFGYIANTGDAHARGFDVSVTVQPTSALSLSASVTYTDATFAKNVFLPGTTPGTAGSVVVSAGDQVGGPGTLGTPWSLTTSAQYHFALAGRALTLRLEDIFHSRNTSQVSWLNPNANLYSPLIPTNPATNVLNGRLSAQLGAVELAVFARNMLNAHPLLDRYQDTPSSLLFTDITLPPRSFGLSADLAF